MLSISLPVYNWVKNVYRLCAQGGSYCVPLLTGTLNQATYTYQNRVQPRSFTHFSTSFTPGEYTAFFSQFNPLITHLYTLSTVPITNKKS